MDPSAEQNGKQGVTLMSAHVAAVPLYLNFHHRLARKVEMIYSFGMAGGYMFSERVRNKNYSDELRPEQGILDASNGASNINLFVDYYVGAHAGVGEAAYLKKQDSACRSAHVSVSSQ
ncbi:MAG: hypothetical protein R2813_09120 [Flavobacteriales bacterium]